MKSFFPIFCLFFLLLGSCAQQEEVVPEAEKVPTCHLQGLAVVEDRVAGHNGSDPFFYVALLDDRGLKTEDVFPGILLPALRKRGQIVELTYHYSYSEKFSYVSACGPDEYGQPLIEVMRKIQVCKIEAVGD